MLLPEPVEQLEAVDARHPDVEQDHVGVRLGHSRQYLAAGLRLRDDLEVRVLLEGKAHGLEDECVIVRNEKPNWPHESSSSAVNGCCCVHRCRIGAKPAALDIHIVIRSTGAAIPRTSDRCRWLG